MRIGMITRSIFKLPIAYSSMSPTNLETIGSAGPANDNLSRFVVALDESQQSLDALKWMLEHMASPERNLLICLHVTDTIDPMKLPRRMDWSQLSGEKGIEALHVHTPEDSPILQNARKMVRAQVQGKEPEQQVLFCEYVHQTPKVGICEFAKEQRADLIVTGLSN